MAFPPKELSQEGSFLAGEFMNNYKHVEFNLTQLEFRNTLNVREIKSSFPTCPKEEGDSFSSVHSELPCCLSPNWPLVLPGY